MTTATMTTDFDAFRQMQQQLHKEETEVAEARLISDGTWVSTLDSYDDIAVEKLPHAGVIGKRLKFNVDENGTNKFHWVNVYFTPVMTGKGKLDLASKLGVQLLEVASMQEGENYTDVLDRIKGMPINQRISKKPASNGYKARNTTWAFSAVR